MRHALALLLLVLVVFFSPPSARAQWQVDGVPICTAANNQEYETIVSIISDGAGGAIVAWQDYRGATTPDIYVQRVNALGAPQWTVNGVALCSAAGSQENPTIVSDGAGGAIVTWDDSRGGADDIYAQRVNASGIPQWTANGVALCAATNWQYYPAIVSDGAGGAIITWEDSRSAPLGYDIYAQRVNASGVPQWTADGIALCNAANGQTYPTIVSDGVGGAIVTWKDYRNGTTTDIYTQRVNTSGVPQWTADGVALCTAVNIQESARIVSDGAQGAIVAWSDNRPALPGVYAQRVNAAGAPQWMADGVRTAAESDPFFKIESDGAGGAIVTWEDFRSGSGDVYAQRTNALGVFQWTVDGVALCTAVDDQNSLTIVSDGTGGAIVTWHDPRSGTNTDIYAQRVDATGVPQWAVDGVAVCIAVNYQLYPVIASDGTGGAIVAWEDTRGGKYDVYAQHVADPSNAVAIAYFDATESDGVVTLRSAFRSDLRVETVNVYRGGGSADNPLTIIERAHDVRGDGFDYVDRDVAPGQTYRYQIGVVDADGEFFSPIVTVSVNAIAGELSQNIPNPFNPTTTIRFTLPAREDVTLAIYDTNGQLVRTLVNEVEGYGAHEVTWDGRDDNGATVGSGVYFYRLHAGKLTESKKMVLLK
jgi:hypothetical protein